MVFEDTQAPTWDMQDLDPDSCYLQSNHLYHWVQLCLQIFTWESALAIWFQFAPSPKWTAFLKHWGAGAWLEVTPSP